MKHRSDNIDARHIRAFLAVSESLNFRGAAARLHVTQPALSTAIKQLEEALEVKLFERTTRRVQLTAAGAEFRHHAARAIAVLREGADSALRAANGQEGHLTIGFAGSVAYGLVPRIVRDYSARYPRVTVSLRGERLTSTQVTELRRGSIDVGFLRLPAEGDGLELEVLAQERLLCALPSDHPLTRRKRLRLGDLRNEPLVAYPSRPPSVLQRTIGDACRAAGFEPHVAHEAAETSTLISLVAAGLGVALVPEAVTELTIPSVRYKQLQGAPTSELALAWRRDDKSKVLHQFLAVARKYRSGFGNG